jgi:hypothetical protein
MVENSYPSIIKQTREDQEREGLVNDKCMPGLALALELELVIIMYEAQDHTGVMQP